MASQPSKPPVDSWRHLHLWQIQPIRDVLVFSVIFAVIWLGYKLSIVTVPILLAMALAYLFEPVVERMTRSGRVGRARVALSIIVLAALLIGVPAVLGVSYSVIQAFRFID